MTLDCNTGIAEFPDVASIILQDGFGTTIPQKMRGLGGKTLLVEDTTAKIKVLMLDNVESQLFLEWWVTELDYGTNSFQISLPIMGAMKLYNAKIKGNLQEVYVSNAVRELSLELVILDDLGAI